MKSIVFGGSGFIGKHLINKLKSDYINYDIESGASNYVYCDVRTPVQVDLSNQEGVIR